jgi:phosphate starvation-inducible PhoH-like protein
MQQQRPTRKQKRIARQNGGVEENTSVRQTNISIDSGISPMTNNQKFAFKSWDDGYNLMLHGMAGTGKTFLALYFGLSEILKKDSQYKKVWIIRSTVSSRDQGFLPGSPKEKSKVYEAPYVPICAKLFGRGDAYDVLKGHNKIEFVSTSYLRGETFEDCIVIVDEMQNMIYQELDTIMTRIGENCRVIFAGDVKQDDLTNERKKEVSGLRDFMKVINRMKMFDFIEFQIEDIVRSKLVKEYIIEKDRLGF